MADDHLTEGASAPAEAALKATQDILRVISNSRDDERPVFQAILDSAIRLCDADSGSLMLIDDQREHTVLKAMAGLEWGFEVDVSTWPLDLGHAQTEAARTGEVVHEVDLKDTDIYRSGDETRVRLVDEIGLRTALAAPLVQGDVPIGVIVLHRIQVARAFSDDDISLLESFAAQAVIAIENARQFREVQERLERERASAEILEVISQSRDDEKPVFDAILRNVAKLCDTPDPSLALVQPDGKSFRFAALLGKPRKSFNVGDEWLLDKPHPVPTSIRENRTVQVKDLARTDLYLAGDDVVVRLVDEEGLRSRLAVPLSSEGEAIGSIMLGRKSAGGFTEAEITLIQTFAAQAVIAIENVRQFREVQERLEREKATKDVLYVISQSRDDEQPVFETILRNAARLCDAPQAVLFMTDDAERELIIRATVGVDEALLETLPVNTLRLDLEDSYSARAVRECRMIHFEDIRDDDAYRNHSTHRVAAADVGGIRTSLAVPLVLNGKALGVLMLNRLEVRPFAQDQIAVVEGFAAQAVIAIENVRQFREVQERLERERATKEVLSIISQSRDDETPVFDKILTLAKELCEVEATFLLLLNSDRTSLIKVGAAGEKVETLERGSTIPLDDPVGVANAARTGEVVNNADLKDDDLYRQGHPLRRRLVDEEGVLSQLAVPLLKGDQPIGVIALNRRMQKAFTADEVALIESFAAQAVIAIENVRQFKALETLNAELGDRVQDQVGEIERMGRLKRFLPSAVADAVVTSGDESMLTSHRALVATLFCDMRGFTAFCESAEPEETIEVLQTYHQEMSDLIDKYGGGVDQRAGDGIMVIFNDPIPIDDPAGDAVRLAVAMREKMKELCAGWKRLGYRLGFGVGVSLGYATVGMVGSAGRFDYTASGTSVNTAARLCDMAADGEILISPRVWIAVEGEVQAESRGEVEMKGIREPVEVFSVQ